MGLGRWMSRCMLFCWLIVASATSALAGNTHGLPDPAKESQAWWKDYSGGYITSGCAPAFSALTLTAFACDAYVQDSELAYYVTQATAAVGPLNAGNGTYWVAVHRDTSTAVSGWTRQTGTHYLWQLSASQPATAAGTYQFAKVTVAAGAITAVSELGTRHITANETVSANRTVDLTARWSFGQGGIVTVAGGVTLTFCGEVDAPKRPIFTVTGTLTFCANNRTEALYPQWFGAAQDGTTDDSAAFTATLAAVPATSSGAMTVRLLPGVHMIGSTITLNKRVVLQGVGNRPDTNTTLGATIIKKTAAMNATGINITVPGVKLEGFTLDGTAGNGGIGITVHANSTAIRDVAVVNQGGSGIRVGDPTTANGVNANSWYFSNVGAMNNGADGFRFEDNTDGADRDANAGTCVGCFARGNASSGFGLIKASANTFLNILAEANTGRGVYVSDISGTNRFFGGDLEGNTLNDLHCDTANLAGGGGYNVYDLNCCSLDGSGNQKLQADPTYSFYYLNEYRYDGIFDKMAGAASTVDMATWYANKAQNDAAYLFLQVTRHATAGNRRASLDVKDIGGTARLLALNPSGGPVTIGGTTTPGAGVGLSVNQMTLPVSQTWATINALTPVDGMMGYCSDCTIGACATPGTGAHVRRNPSGWVCY